VFGITFLALPLGDTFQLPWKFRVSGLGGLPNHQ